MKKIVITVVGKDRVGIIAKTCNYLAENHINILDISQTIVDGYFNMMMVAEWNPEIKDFPVMQKELEEVGKEIGVVIQAQLADIFDRMHRL